MSRQPYYQVAFVKERRMTEPSRELPTPILLRLVYFLLSERIFQGIVDAGFTDLRPAYGNAMESLSLEDGLRLTDLAKRAGMTAQSMGELVDDLERKGYLERREDPADRRAKRIYLTPKGKANAEAGRIATQAVEVTLRRLLGALPYDQLRESLSRILQDMDSKVPLGD
jgi:DNA-binding MarR family transcriptional regulator